MEQIKDIEARINAIITGRKQQISAEQTAIDEGRKAIDKANAEAEAALSAGDESGYVTAKQKASEAAARVEFHTRRLAAVQKSQELPESKEIMSIALAACVGMYKDHAARCLELIDELSRESEAAAAAAGKYESMKSRWRNIDNVSYYPDFPNQSALGITRNLSFARSNLAAYLGKK